MDLRRMLAVTLFVTALVMAFSGMAEAANGTVKVTLKYKNGSGVEQPLVSAYLYLRNAAESPPLEQYLKKADYIYGPSDASGRINASVPEGSYFIRITKRAVAGGSGPLGPPKAGDYTWTDYQQVTVTAGSITDLGTKYAASFSEPITISGIIVNSTTGAPLAGRYVRAQTEPCVTADYSSQNEAEWRDSNRCGPVKYMAQRRTDAQGRYTLLLRDPGTYYIVESLTLGDNHQQYTGNPGSTGWAVGPITVSAGDKIVLGEMRVPAGY